MNKLALTLVLLTALLTPVVTAVNDDFISLNCPYFATTTAIDLNATYFQQSTGFCTTPTDPEPLVLRVVEPDGIRVFYSAQECLNGVHSFNGVNTTKGGTYNLTAFLGTASKECSITSINSQKIVFTPETNLAIIALTALIALFALSKGKRS